MPTQLGAHNPRIDAVRSLRSKKGRAEQRAFVFEGPTLLEEAVRSGLDLQALYVTAQAFSEHAAVREADAAGLPVFLVDERTLARLSDLETPSGIVAVSGAGVSRAGDLLTAPGTVAVLAGINDPGNAGTLLRSAEAFGVNRVIFGEGGVEPYHPKVVRAAMGALFRLHVAQAAPFEVLAAAQGWEVTGLSVQGEDLRGLQWPARSLIVVGHERSGLGEWEPLCTRLAMIPMPGPAESLNAAVAGSIAFYEAAGRTHPAT